MTLFPLIPRYDDIIGHPTDILSSSPSSSSYNHTHTIIKSVKQTKLGLKSRSSAWFQFHFTALQSRV